VISDVFISFLCLGVEQNSSILIEDPALLARPIDPADRGSLRERHLGLGGDARVLAEGIFEDVDDAAVVEIASGQLAGDVALGRIVGP
jgi:hypothetical protein